MASMNVELAPDAVVRFDLAVYSPNPDGTKSVSQQKGETEHLMAAWRHRDHTDVWVSGGAATLGVMMADLLARMSEQFGSDFVAAWNTRCVEIFGTESP